MRLLGLTAARQPARQPARTGRRSGFPPRGRRGVTIIELIVAIMILSFGMLALAGVSVVVMGQMRSAANQTVAASMLQSRFEPFERRSCASISDGSRTYRGIDETWTTRLVSARARHVSDSVRFPGERRRRSVAVSTVVSCNP